MTTATTLLLILTIITSTIATTKIPPNNITAILSTYPQFTTFNHHLTTTSLADLINNLTDITVCAVDNSVMSDFLSLNPSPSSLKLILTSHLFSGYSDEEFLRQSCCAWTMYPLPSGSGHQILDLRGPSANFSFATPFSDDRSTFLGILHKNTSTRFSVIHVSAIFPSPEAEFLRRPINLTEVFSSVGCGKFAGALANLPEAERKYRVNVYAGMTVMCPIDEAFENNLSRFTAIGDEEKLSVLLYHALPIYYNEFEINEGLDDPATLWSYCGEGGVWKEAVMDMEVVERIMVKGAAYDRGPLAVYLIKGVLFPGDREKVVEFAPVIHAAVEPELAVGLDRSIGSSQM